MSALGLAYHQLPTVVVMCRLAVLVLGSGIVVALFECLGELVEARLESDEMHVWLKLEPLPVGSSPIAALAAVCRGP